MEALEKLRDFIDNLEDKDFKKYLIITLSIFILIPSVLIFRYYRKITHLRKRIKDINIIREEDVRRILGRAEQVQKEREDVDAMLAEEPDFKIRGFFEKMLAALGLSDKTTIESPSQIDREDKYRESILNVKLTNMDMKQLTELLYKLQQTRRIHTKELEITKSKKKPGTIDVSLTISTLLLK